MLRMQRRAIFNAAFGELDPVRDGPAGIYYVIGQFIASQLYLRSGIFRLSIYTL